MTYRIPFNKPGMTGDELHYMSDAIARGHAAGDGEYTKRCHAILQETFGVPRALLTTSCTHALEMAALLLDVKPGDEIILPSFTFVSTANAFVLRGARTVFCDIRPDTLNLDEACIEQLITPRTRAIVPVHYAGVGCEMDEIMRIARQHGIAVVEDNAHALFGRYRGRYLGTFGQTATQSFHETKNVTCGEGGALLLNDESLIERAEILREKGTNRSRYFRGEVDKYSWVGVGSSYLLSDLLAAFLCAQLERSAQIQSTRRRIWETYDRELATWAAAQHVRQPYVPGHCEQAYHMYYLMMPSLQARTALIQHLKQKSILSVFHYIPLHLSEMGQSLGGYAGQCPNTERAGECLLRLPFYNGLTEGEQAEVVEAILQFQCGAVNQ